MYFKTNLPNLCVTATRALRRTLALLKHIELHFVFKLYAEDFEGASHKIW